VSRTQTGPSVVRLVADEKSWQLLKNIAQGAFDSKSLKSNSKLTRKQYYSRLSGMTRSKLVTKRNGKYRLTTFGKIVYEFQLIIENALEDHWKLKTIDSLELSKNLPEEDRKKLIDTLFENQDLKHFLRKGFYL
jgi:hypothetical protein